MNPSKFKMSEIGTIPDEWNVTTLGEVLQIGNGRDYKHLGHGPVPVYGTGGVMTYVNDYLYEGPTVCIGRKGTIDQPQYHEGKVWTVDTLFYTHSFKGVIPKYLYFLFSRIDWLSYNSATGVPSLTSKAISGIQIPVPSLPEQKKIAEALSDIDALLSSMDRLIEKKRAIKQGAMQQLLAGKKRLAGFTGKWMEKRLGEIADFVTATTPTAAIDLKWYIGTENMLADKAGVIQNDAEVPYKAVREYLKGDVLVSNIRPYLKKIWLADRDGGCSTDVLVIRTHDSSICTSEFLAMMISDDAFFDFAMSNAVGTKMPRGDKKVLVNFGVKIPALDEQLAIAVVLSDMDTDIAALEKKRAKYEGIKQGMMQNLLTGKMRLGA